MGRAISVPQRQVIFQRTGLGHQADDVADDLGLNPKTVRTLMARFAKAGAAGITPGYARCGLNQARRSDVDLIGEVIMMRCQHTTWGAGIIRVVLAERHPDRTLPSERAILRAFAKVGLNPAPAGRRRGGPGRRAERPHDTWQIDAADQMKLVDTARASWLRIVDECSGAVLETAVFPPRVLEHRTGRRDPSDAPPLLREVGAAATDPGGQRDALEVERRPAHRAGTLAGRAGRRGQGQPAALPAAQRRGRAFAGHRQAVGRAAPDRLGGGTPDGH